MISGATRAGDRRRIYDLSLAPSLGCNLAKGKIFSSNIISLEM
jgi:hypothetical protein